MWTTNFDRGGTQAKTLQELFCFFPLVGVLQQEFNISLFTINILLSITAVLGNFLVLVALHKESSLHPPSKLLYRCLATTDLLVGLVAQPLNATYWMSVVQEHWSLCRNAFDAATITSFALCGVSLMTMMAISVDRLLALLLGLRYKQIVTLTRTYIIVATFWIVSSVAGLSHILDYRILICSDFSVGRKRLELNIRRLRQRRRDVKIKASIASLQAKQLAERVKRDNEVREQEFQEEMVQRELEWKLECRKRELDQLRRKREDEMAVISAQSQAEVARLEHEILGQEFNEGKACNDEIFKVSKSSPSLKHYVVPSPKATSEVERKDSPCTEVKPGITKGYVF
ncbi:Adenosine receptor A2b [Stylophora pistillata]|uniref:Adenosine receptor A2b n=1 Tax=Stylophora pistillata TaxID=50429 RepID=A0A2B4SQF2_STYPI|nr:Adenosine receptor A2b [Stylophora pistillata]